jgi:WD repeat-containing protein 55
VVTASSEGVLNIFSWDWFGDCNDRIVGHPSSIDTMIKYDEDTVITGCEDGLIRAVSILPNRIVAILGDPIDTDDEIFHIQKVSLSHDKQLLVSCSFDDIVKIIDVSHLADRPKDGTAFDLEAYEASIQSKLKPNHGKLTSGDMMAGEEKEETKQ